MFDIGLFELLVVGGVGLAVIGPDKLPGTIRTGALWFGRIKRGIVNTRREIEQQIGADEIRRELRNEEIMASLEKLKETREQLEADINNAANTIEHQEEKYEPDDHHDEHGNYIGHHDHDDHHHDDDHFDEHHANSDHDGIDSEIIDDTAAAHGATIEAAADIVEHAINTEEQTAQAMPESEPEKLVAHDAPADQVDSDEKTDKPAQS